MPDRDELEAIGFVLCSQCGAHIRADRERCLRCNELLVPYTPSELSLPGWITAIGGGTMIFAVVFLLVLIVIVVTLYDSVQAMDDRPASAVGTSKSAS